MKSWSLRWQIVGWSALVTGLSLLTFVAVAAFNLYAEHVEMIDVQLETNARLVFNDHGDVNRDLLAELTKPHRRKAETPLHGFALLRTRDRSLVLAQPASLADAVMHWPPARWPPQRTFHNATIEGTRLRLGTFKRGDNTLLLAASLEPAEESVFDLLGAALIAIPAVLIVVAGGSWWIARRALAPIAGITRAAASITAHRLDERLPAPRTDDEIGRHTEVLNGMFDRLQRSFEQATRFTADAAHELRTPLTIMRGQIEEALRSGRFNPEQETVLVDLLEENSGLQKITDNLLLLARFDTGKNALQHEPVDLSALLAESVEDAELLAAPKGLTVASDITPALRVDGDAVMLRRLALNLLDNAVKFNREKGEVKLVLRVGDEDTVHLIVGNTGPGIPPDRRAALFERFYRTANSRNRDSGGSGLGLSLCREITVAHGGQIDLIRADAEWTEFSVQLPRLGGTC